MSENWAPSVGDLREIYAAYITRNHDSYTSGISLEDARDVYRSQFYRAIAAHAARIARGGTRASVELVERCERCGCDLRYPTVAHIVDCGTRKEQD